MDRRGFLKVLGVGGVLVAAAPKLILPPVRTALAEPGRRFFLPPAPGWPVEALALPDLPAISEDRIARVLFPQLWNLKLIRPWRVPPQSPQWDRPVQIGGVGGWLMGYEIDSSADGRLMLTERYRGLGVPPDITALKHLGKVELTIESQPIRLPPW